MKTVNTFESKTVGSSSRFDRSASSLFDALEYYVGDMNAELVYGTEITSAERRKAIRGVAQRNGHSCYLGNNSYRDDSWLMWSKEEWQVTYQDSINIPTGRLNNIHGRQMVDNSAILVELVHRETGFKLLVSGIHLPSGVEKGGRLVRTARGLAWLKEVRGWRKEVNRYAREYGVDGIRLFADWNIDIKKKSNRVLIKTLFPKYRSDWGNGPFPAGGTLGNRIVDFGLTKGNVRSIRVGLTKDDNSSDHRPYKSVLKFSIKGKKPKKLPPSGGTA